MKNMIIIGNAGSNTEIKTTQEGNQFAVVSVAVNLGNKNNSKTDWVDLIFNDKLMDFASKYVLKGTKVFVSGFPSINAYINKNGQIVANQKIYVEKLELLGKADNSQEAKITDFEPMADF